MDDDDVVFFVVVDADGVDYCAAVDCEDYWWVFEVVCADAFAFEVVDEKACSDCADESKSWEAFDDSDVFWFFGEFDEVCHVILLLLGFSVLFIFFRCQELTTM